jgi:NADH:ubiquinone oxidoreductase subunit 6 (subunit J)
VKTKKTKALRWLAILLLLGGVVSSNYDAPFWLALGLTALALVLMAINIKLNPDEAKNPNTIRDFQSMNKKMLPPVFKWIGFGVALAGFVLVFTVPMPKTPYFWLGVMVLGLSVAMLSRERREDELLREVRLQAAFFALIFAAWWFCYTVMMPDTSRPAWSTVLIALLGYHLVFIIQKRKLRDEEHD